jgi:hypothetical protein
LDATPLGLRESQPRRSEPHEVNEPYELNEPFATLCALRVLCGELLAVVTAVATAKA